MAKAIKIKLTKAPKDYDYGASKLFGDPTVPSEWEDRFYEDIIFFGQIRLCDIERLDPENRLPHKGYLYLFLDTAAYPYDVWVDYREDEPDMLIEEFNAELPGFEWLGDAYLMSFEECDEYEDCTRLFGKPSRDVASKDENAQLLLQFDPLDNDTGFLSEVDGFAYVFYDTDKKDIDGATYLVIDGT